MNSADATSGGFPAWGGTLPGQRSSQALLSPLKQVAVSIPTPQSAGSLTCLHDRIQHSTRAHPLPFGACVSVLSAKRNVRSVIHRKAIWQRQKDRAHPSMRACEVRAGVNRCRM